MVMGKQTLVDKKFKPFGSRLLALTFFAIALALSPAVHAASYGGKATPQDNDEFAKLRIRKIAPPEAARDFVLDEIHGNKVSLSALRGKVVVVNF
jgi:cytochrome oxidase Cu insertion factor (SCO1/SenC/PrrC family)